MRDKAGLLLPIFIITVAEAFYFDGSAESCLGLHALNIFVCILLPIWSDKRMLLYQSFALVSLLRVLNIGMPVFFTETLLWMPFVYGPIIVAGYIVWRQTVADAGKLQWRNLLRFLNGHGLRPDVKWKWEYLLVAIIFGYLVANLEYFVLGNTALVKDLGPLDLGKLFLVMVVFVGFGEELIFRGLLQSSVEKEHGKYVAIIVSALMFSIMHSGYQNAPYLLFVFGVGLALAYAYERTGSLGLVALMHGILNFFLFSFLPFGYGLLP
ncbi:MAG TPA: CPBP family intramembrane metalloprotease [Methanomassiliicoccales archaeon]|nr:CPBP family intramembrane metalloprotease [Methanomassiliicoccales archaeon]